MTNRNTEHLERCILTLESAWRGLADHQPGDIAHDIHRAACVKEFEIILEQGGKLLRKRLADWLASDLGAARLTFRAVFREAARYGLLEADACERWLAYRDARNETAHDYGAAFADRVLALLPRFLDDARDLAGVLREAGDG